MNTVYVCSLQQVSKSVSPPSLTAPKEAEEKARRYIPSIVKFVATRLVSMAF